MDFLDSLKQIKKELIKEQKVEHKKTRFNSSQNTDKNKNYTAKTKPKESHEDSIDKQMQEVFLKEEKLRDEFEKFIEDSDIKKIF